MLNSIISSTIHIFFFSERQNSTIQSQNRPIAGQLPAEPWRCLSLCIVLDKEGGGELGDMFINDSEFAKFGYFGNVVNSVSV